MRLLSHKAAKPVESAETADSGVVDGEMPNAGTCGACGAINAVIKLDGCPTCVSCGDSKCG